MFCQKCLLYGGCLPAIAKEENYDVIINTLATGRVACKFILKIRLSHAAFRSAAIPFSVTASKCENDDAIIHTQIMEQFLNLVRLRNAELIF